jgi:hypothetical protein
MLSRTRSLVHIQLPKIPTSFVIFVSFVFRLLLPEPGKSKIFAVN